MAIILRAMRFVGALAILAVGAIHLLQYIGADYRAIPIVGTLFLLNAIASAIVGIGLLAPVKQAAAAHRAKAPARAAACSDIPSPAIDYRSSSP